MIIKGIVVLVFWFAGLLALNLPAGSKSDEEPLGAAQSSPVVEGMQRIRAVHKGCGESSWQDVWPGRYNTVICPHCGRLFLLSPQGVDKSDLMEPRKDQGPTAMTRP